MAIYFYKINEAYGSFSNFSHHGFLWWMTSEHYFQAKNLKELNTRKRLDYWIIQ